MSNLTEFELIARLTAGAPREAKDLIRGVGDDCAVIAGPGGRDWLVTADALIENVHFNLKWADLKALGRKALSVNLSDIAAMGGTPRFYLVAIGLPPKRALSIAEPIYAGMRETAKEHGLIMIGGDTVASPSSLTLSITAIGEIERSRCLYRSGARAGDAIYITGTSGGSALGLCCLKAGFKGDDALPFIKRHLDPMPRIAEGQWIANSRMATAMIDVSDGIVADLSHIADESGAGFEVDVSAVPRDPGFGRLAGELGHDPVDLALTGGEDYELLFTIAGDRADELRRIAAQCPGGCKMTRIGTITADSAARIVKDAKGCAIKLKTMGFNHFT